jgi:hypothetical protein
LGARRIEVEELPDTIDREGRAHAVPEKGADPGQRDAADRLSPIEFHYGSATQAVCHGVKPTISASAPSQK